MKKIITFALALSLLLTLSIGVSAFSQGYDADGRFEDALTEAAGGKNVLRNPEFIDGGLSFDNEGAENLFDFDETTKYCTNEGNAPITATWKYDKAFVAERIILGTANDSEQYHRRMGNPWTLEGSANGTDWTVIYTGTPNDMDHTNFTLYYVDLPDNTTAYQYYKFNAEEIDWEDDLATDAFQMSEFILCGSEASAAAEEAPAEETPAEEVPAEEAPAEETPAEETPAEAPAQETPVEVAPVVAPTTTTAPATSDMTIVYVLAAVLAVAAGALAIRAKKSNI